MLINISCLSFSLVVGFGMCKKLGFMGIMRNFEDHWMAEHINFEGYLFLNIPW
jgi:hypothetical protein